MKALSRMMLWQKLAVLVVAMVIPSVMLGLFYLSSVNAQVALAQDELQGARYAQALGAVLDEVAHHRNRLYAVLAGETAGRDDLALSESETDRLLKLVDAIDASVGERYRVSGAWHAIKSDWERLKSDSAKLAPDEAVAHHNSLLEQILKLGEL